VAKKRGRRKEEEKGNDAKKTPEANSSNVIPIRGGGKSVEVLSADETYANKVHLKIIGLLRQYEEIYFKMAQALYEVKRKKLYRSIDQKYNTFEEYVESIGVEFRKAKYLTRIWWWYGVEQNANPKLLEGAQEIGWTKAKELVEVIDGRNATRWFRLAKEMNAEDLKRAARAAKKAAEEHNKEKNKKESKKREEEARLAHRKNAQDDDDNEPDELPKGMKVLDPKSPKTAQLATTEMPPGDPVTLTEAATEGIDPPDDVEAKVEAQKEASKEWKKWIFSVHKDSWKIVEDAMRYAGEMAESEHKGHIFSLICLHFCSFYDGQRSVMIGELLAQLERSTGLSMVALDKRSNEIVYGSDLIDELAATGGEDEGE